MSIFHKLSIKFIDHCPTFIHRGYFQNHLGRFYGQWASSMIPLDLYWPSPLNKYKCISAIFFCLMNIWRMTLQHHHIHLVSYHVKIFSYYKNNNVYMLVTSCSCICNYGWLEMCLKACYCYKFITNLLSFISTMYKFSVISDFHRFIKKSHEFHVMVNMIDVFTYLIS
jgi:hypothetical protein